MLKSQAKYHASKQSFLCRDIGAKVSLHSQIYFIAEFLQLLMGHRARLARDIQGLTGSVLRFNGTFNNDG